MEGGLHGNTTEKRSNYKNHPLNVAGVTHCNAPEKSILLEEAVELPTMLTATTWMVYVVPSINPLSTVLVVDAVVCTGGDPLLGTAVTVYPVTGGLLADTTGGVHVTVIDEAEVAAVFTPRGGGGTARTTREKMPHCKKYLHAHYIEFTLWHT